MKKGDIVIAPEGCNCYLTAGKEYVVDRIDGEFDENFGFFFWFTTDRGSLQFDSTLKGNHVNGKDWIIKEAKEQSSESTTKKTKQAILRLYLSNPDQAIKSEKIIDYVKQEIGTGYVFGDTILRALRQLRQDGKLDYEIDGAKKDRNYKFKKI